MAEVSIKTNFFAPSDGNGSFNHRHRHLHLNPHGISVFPNKSAVFSCASAFPSLKLRSSPQKSNFSSSISDFYGRRLVLGDQQTKPSTKSPPSGTSSAQMRIGIGKAQRWWEKGLQPNMKEVTGAQDLVDSLLNAGDKLVVVDFFSPGCGGCKALHPKICQLAEMNPDVQFLQVNHEEHKSMCYTLHVHVLPFFRFYRGSHGRVCSFSCTNATIKKFKDALAKYGGDASGLWPAKGLEEQELLALAANKDLNFSHTPKSEPPVAVPLQEEIFTVAVEVSPNANLGPPLPLPHPLSSTASAAGSQKREKESLIPSGR